MINNPVENNYNNNNNNKIPVDNDNDNSNKNNYKHNLINHYTDFVPMMANQHESTIDQIRIDKEESKMSKMSQSNEELRSKKLDDWTPNPQKLLNLLLNLDAILESINSLKNINPTESNFNSKKEKNKLSSRACRLKKKAHFEANKIKLDGLKNEERFLSQLLETCQNLVANPEAQPNDLLQGLNMIESFENNYQCVSKDLEAYIEDIIQRHKDK